VSLPQQADHFAWLAGKNWNFWGRLGVGLALRLLNLTAVQTLIVLPA
jgi:hypothetical protein